MLLPNVPQFQLANLDLCHTMQAFLQRLQSEMPPDMDPDLHQRISMATSHIQTGSMLSRDAWCHMDLVIFFASRENLPFWTPGRTPIHSPLWLGQHSAAMGLPDLMRPSVAFNAVDHFTVLTPGISPEQHQEAVDISRSTSDADPPNSSSDAPQPCSLSAIPPAETALRTKVSCRCGSEGAISSTAKESHFPSPLRPT